MTSTSNITPANTEPASPLYELDGFASDPDLQSLKSDDWWRTSEEDQHWSEDKKAASSPMCLHSSEALVADNLTSSQPRYMATVSSLPVFFRIGPGRELNRTAIAWTPANKDGKLKKIIYRWTYGRAFTRTRTLWDGNGVRLWNIERLSITRHGHWVASIPGTGEKVMSIERKAILPLRMQVRVKNDLLYHRSGNRASSSPSTEEEWTNWTAKRTPLVGWTVLTDTRRVVAEYSKALAYEFDVTVAPSTPTAIVAALGFIFREVEVVLRRTRNKGAGNLVRKGIAMSTSRG